MRLRLIPLWLSFLALASVTALAADEGEQKKPEHKTSQSKSYLSLEPIYTTIVNDNQAQGMLMVGIGLDVPSEELREVIGEPSLYNESLGTVSNSYMYDRLKGREVPPASDAASGH